MRFPKSKMDPLRLKRRQPGRRKAQSSGEPKEATMKDLNRRRVLRGMLNGGGVTVALPLLNCFLNNNGTALASGAPMPVRFATWFWGLGCDSSIFVPKTKGANYELPPEIASWAPVKQHINLFTN